MKCTEIYRNGNQFYLKLSTDRWWQASPGKREWCIRPFDGFEECVPSTTYSKSNDDDNDTLPRKGWSKCSRLDYLTVTTRSLDKDVEVINKVVEEAWRSATTISYIDISETAAETSVRAVFDKSTRNRKYQDMSCNKYPEIVSGGNPDKVQLEWPY